MNKEEDILYNKTQKFGRTQFVRELARLQQENKQLKEEIKSYQDMYFDKVMTINKAIEHLNIKQIRFLNEKDYILNNEDLDKIIEILKGEE